MKIIEQHLTDNQFLRNITFKSQIVLHHTVSKSGKNVKDWFQSNPERVAVSFVVETNGDIYELFDSQYWAYHIGKGSSTKDNMKAIGIEIANEGGLILKDGLYYWNNMAGNPKYIYKGVPIILEKEFRGFKAFASYTSAQFKAVNELLNMLCKKHSIPHKWIGNLEYNKANFQFNGIVAHCNLRADKSDISPAYKQETI